MKTLLFKLTFIFLSVMQIIACRKKDVLPPNEKEVCKITEMTYNMMRPSTAKFTYNSVGNPVSVVISNVSTGNPHALFLYDQYNRLTDHIGTYQGFTDPANMPAFFVFEYWVRYVYEDDKPSSMPVRDTLRQHGGYINGRFDLTAFTTIEQLTYDSQGRIIQGNGYDANGNLIIPNATYDNKKNFRRTNKVWMLVDRNYSVNNPYIANSYNDAGLPTTFPAPTPPNPYIDNFLRRGMNILTMTYACSTAPKGK